MDQKFDKRTQQQIANFSQRLEAIAAEHAQALHMASAHALMRDMESLCPSPPLSKQIVSVVGRLGRRVGQRLRRRRSNWQAKPHPFGAEPDPLVVIDGTFRVIAPDEMIEIEEDVK
jgi:hypothetical protein